MRVDDDDAARRMSDWLDRACVELGVDREAVREVTPMLLDLVRDVAHARSRPAAPLTAFLVGVAAASTDGSPEELAARVLGAVQRLRRCLGEPM